MKWYSPLADLRIVPIGIRDGFQEDIAVMDNSVTFDQELIVRYGGRGPRYTSYPTALQFEQKFTAEDYRQQVAASNASDRPLSLYVHVPFCKTLCYYCACNKIVTRNAERVQNYMRALYTEIDMQADLFDAGRPVEQLHFGGGTPTYLANEQLKDLMRQLGSAFSLDASEEREFSIEVDPRSVDTESMALLAELGFNRLSLGVQDFDPTVQHAVNRIQTAQDVQGLLDDARRHGFKSVSFDLIYGLPHQTVESFDRTLTQVIAMRPDRLAIYNYAHLPDRFKGQRMIHERDIPAPETKLDILGRTIEKLGTAGYVYIGMDHFALPGDELVQAQHEGSLQRNFQGYSTHAACDLIGLGVSAIGSIGESFAQNTPSTIEYEALIGEHKLPLKRGLVVDADDQLRASVISALMCYDHLNYDEFDRQHDIDFREYFARELQMLQTLEQDGLVTVDDDAIRISGTGRLLLRSIAMVFDRYLNAEQNDGRFSRAI